MKIKVKKNVLRKSLGKLLNELSRSDNYFDNSNHNFVGNFGSVKGPFDEDEEDVPLKPNNHMPVQIMVL